MQNTAIPAATAEAKASAEHLANYLAVMAGHDWRFEWADDYSVWKAGQSSLAALRQAQPIVDPDFKHWNRCAPEDFQVHVFTPSAPAPGASS